jgi:LysR family carnitine catabolism transcriptional activator
MNFNLSQLRAFVAVARAASFTRAAALLHLSQPALSVRIRSLEAVLGLRLLDRNTRAVRMTAVGRELLPVFERVLADIRAVAENARELAAGGRGTVRVAALPSVCTRLLPAAIASLRASHPGITVQLHDLVARRIVGALLAEEADVGIGTFERNEAGLEVSPLFEDRMVAVFPARHPLRAKRRVTLAELARWPLVSMDTQSSVRALVNRALAAQRIAAAPAFEVTYMSTALALVQARLGVAILPATAFELGTVRGLESRPIAGAHMRRRIGVAHKAGRSPAPAAATFVAVLQATARALVRA